MCAGDVWECTLTLAPPEVNLAYGANIRVIDPVPPRVFEKRQCKVAQSCVVPVCVCGCGKIECDICGCGMSGSGPCGVCPAKKSWPRKQDFGGH